MERNMIVKNIQKGFTLVELLIVVIILAILAAIVVPQFASTTDDAKVSSLDSNLTAVRSAIDLYYQQHGKYPGAVAGTQGACVASVEGAGTVGAVSFDTQLRYYTSAAGAVCDIKSGPFLYGPYLKKGLPKNPMTDLATLAIETIGSLNMTDDGAVAGWKFDTVSGKFIANDNTTDAAGLKYSTH